MDRPTAISRPVPANANDKLASLLPSLASNDNAKTRRIPAREAFSLEDFVATRRRLKIQTNALTEGSVGKIVIVRTPGRLYDVSFTAPEAIIVTLSHCDIVRCQDSKH